MVAETRYEHIVLNDDGVPIIAKTKMKVVELVLDHKAYGWSPEELQFQHSQFFFKRDNVLNVHPLLIGLL